MVQREGQCLPRMGLGVCARVSLGTRKGTWVEVCVSSRMILQWEGLSQWPTHVTVAAGGLLRMGKGREDNMGEFLSGPIFT